MLFILGVIENYRCCCFGRYIDDVRNDVLSLITITLMTLLSIVLLFARFVRCIVSTLASSNTPILGLLATSIVNVFAARQHRDKLYHCALSSGTPIDWQLFCQAHKKVNHLLKSTKSQYLTDLCESSKGSS